MNGSTDGGTPGVYVDSTCGDSANPARGGRLRLRFGGTFSASQGALQVAATSGWLVERDLAGDTTAFSNVAAGNDWDQAEFFLSAEQMSIQAAAPVLVTTGVGRFNAWDLRHAFVDGVECMFRIPRSWKSFSVTVKWVSEAGGAGNVVWVVFAANPKAGDILNTMSFPTGTVTTAGGAQYVLTDSQVLGFLPPANNEFTTIAIQRNGSAGGDTLVGAVGVLGVLVRRTG